LEKAAQSSIATIQRTLVNILYPADRAGHQQVDRRDDRNTFQSLNET